MASTIKVAETITRRVRVLLQDTKIPYRWSDQELVDWYNLACRDTVIVKPSANAVTAKVPLSAGTRQTITGFHLLSVVRNMGAGGASPGSVIIPVTRERLDTMLPEWHSDTPSTSVRFVCYDPTDPKAFYCYPPQPNETTQQIEVIQAVAPVPVTLAGVLADTATIPLDDVYEGPIIDAICYRAFLKDAAHAGSSTRAVAHYQAFANALGAKATAEGGGES